MKDENAKGARCRANGVYLRDLNAWRQSATKALALSCPSNFGFQAAATMPPFVAERPA